MYETKTCRKCGETKPLDSFYVKRDLPDGLDPWCKVCRVENNKLYNPDDRKPPKSTQLVLDALKARGIPATPGSGVGLKFVDIAAYGSVPVEAKSAVANTGPEGQEKYIFHFTRAQREKYLASPRGFIVLVAIGVNTRYFVVPASSPIFDFRLAAFTITFNARRYDAQQNFAALRQYEDAFNLIKPIEQAYIPPAPKRPIRAPDAQPALF